MITSVSEATEKDVDIAVEAAQEAFNTTWGLNAPGLKRSQLLMAVADAMTKHKEELAALEALDNGFPAISFFLFLYVDYLLVARQNVRVGNVGGFTSIDQYNTLLRRMGR